MDSIYHIYLKNKCVSHNLTEMQFLRVWNYLSIHLARGNSKYDESDLSYEKLKVDRDTILNSSY